MIKDSIAKVVVGDNLTESEMIAVMNEIMSGACTDAQIASFITALRLKGETVAEITGAARVMREKAVNIEVSTVDGVVMDVVGTGGDLSGTFNVSTTTAFVVAGAGVVVAKHGSRASSSRCGSADVLEELGVDLGLSPEDVGRCIRTNGIGFMFAPVMHGAMKYAIGPRREIGIRTIFNILGPLTNPAGANTYLLGVYDPDLTETIARVLNNFGVRRAMVVCGVGGIDEITTTGETRVSEVAGGDISTYTITPEKVGLAPACLDDLKGGKTVAESAAQLRDVLHGRKGARYDMVLFNAGMALLAASKADSLLGGMELAARVIDSGAAIAKLDSLVEFCSNG